MTSHQGRCLSALARARRLLPLAERADAIELLDSGRLAPSEIEANLADLARLNRLPGGRATSVAGIERLARGDGAPTVLDLGTGRADLPLAFAARGWRTTAVDANPEVLGVARRHVDPHPLIEVVEADARALPFADGAFDVAHCSLLLHHLEATEVVTVLGEMRRVARLGIVINDLRRGLLPLAATGVSVVLFGRSRVTWSDGPTSARRAWTLGELDAFLADAGLAPRWRSAAWMPRVVTTARPIV